MTFWVVRLALMLGDIVGRVATMFSILSIDDPPVLEPPQQRGPAVRGFVESPRKPPKQ